MLQIHLAIKRQPIIAKVTRRDDRLVRVSIIVEREVEIAPYVTHVSNAVMSRHMHTLIFPTTTT